MVHYVQLIILIDGTCDSDMSGMMCICDDVPNRVHCQPSLVRVFHILAAQLSSLRSAVDTMLPLMVTKRGQLLVVVHAAVAMMMLLARVDQPHYWLIPLLYDAVDQHLVYHPPYMMVCLYQ